MEKIKTTTFIEVPFYDLDPMDVVWHGNYVKYLEIARCDFLSKIQYNYNDMKSDGFAYPVATMDMKFIKSASFGQKLMLTTTLEEIEPALIFKYEICDVKTGEKLFKAKSMQICVDVSSRESVYSAPESFVEKIKRFGQR